MKSTSCRAIFPPVFVMNAYYTGIGIARSLHGRGVEVYGLTSEKNAPGIRSRFFDGIYEIPNGRDEPESLCQRLLEIKDRHTQTPVIFPTRDFDVLFLHQYRGQLASFYRLPQPQGQAIPHLLDKFEIAAIANLHHIPVPKTVICTSPQDIAEQIRFLKFPLVVKPRFAYQWRRKGCWQKIGARKAILVESVSQLWDEYHQLTLVTEEILLQEYIPGEDSDLVVCCCYISRSGELLGYFTARKLYQNPPLFGTGCVMEALNVPEIIAPSVQLLRSCGYSGLAEIEFKYDKGTNTFFLIEVNPRHWDQHELGNLVGINLTWIAYQDIIGYRPRPQTPVYRGSIRCIWIAEREAFLLLVRSAYLKIAALRGSGGSVNVVIRCLNIVVKTFWEFARLLRGRKTFALLHPRDPIPSILMCFRMFREVLQAFSIRGREIFLGKKVMLHDTK